MLNWWRDKFSKDTPLPAGRPIKVGDKSYSVYTDDVYLDLMGADFEPHMVALFRKFITKQSVILDVGANIGLTTILFAELGKQVVSFEPSPSTFRLLRNNVTRAQARNTTLVNAALGDSRGESTITFPPSNRSGGFVSNHTRPGKGHTTEQIQIERLDDICQKYVDRVDFIKIDVEGFEGSVLRGAQKTLRRHRPVVALELNHWCLNAFQRTSIPDFFDQLRGTFPTLYAVSKDNTDIKSLHDPDQAYHVMYHHIIEFAYPTIVGAFGPGIEAQLLGRPAGAAASA